MRHLLQKLDPSPVVLDQVIEGSKNRRGEGLESRVVRQPIDIEVADVLNVEMRDSRTSGLGSHRSLRIRPE
jgi:hypothetical protein